MEKTIMTLCIVRSEGRILLGRSKSGMGKGKLNGFGGHVEAGETPETAIIREMREEAGITITDAEKVGFLTFKSPQRPYIEAHIFKATEFQGEPVETAEMIPAWFTKDTIPFMEMWPSDLYWIPYFLKNRLFVGAFEYDENDRIVSHEVKAVVTLPA